MRRLQKSCYESSGYRTTRWCEFSKDTLARLHAEDFREEELRGLNELLELDEKKYKELEETDDCFPKIFPIKDGECVRSQKKRFHLDFELFPNVQIFFYGPFNTPIKSDLRMFNGSIYPMGYRIRTTTPENFIINGNMGILEPLNTKFFTIVFIGNTEIVYKKDHRCKIIIQTHNLPHECGDPCKMWAKLVCDEITVYSVDVVFVPDPQTEFRKMVGCLAKTRERLKKELYFFSVLFLLFLTIVICVAFVGLLVLYCYHVKTMYELNYIRKNIDPDASSRNI